MEYKKECCIWRDEHQHALRGFIIHNFMFHRHHNFVLTTYVHHETACQYMRGSRSPACCFGHYISLLFIRAHSTHSYRLLATGSRSFQFCASFSSFHLVSFHLSIIDPFSRTHAVRHKHPHNHRHTLTFSVSSSLILLIVVPHITAPATSPTSDHTSKSDHCHPDSLILDCLILPSGCLCVPASVSYVAS